MSGDFPFAAKIVSPLKCNEKPWDMWVSEIGHQSPRRDDDGATFTAPAAVERAGARRKDRRGRAGVSRLRRDSMSLHGLFPQADQLGAAVCHLCGVIVKVSAAYRHLRDKHAGAEPLLPPPPPTVKLKATPGRRKKEPAPEPPAREEPPPELHVSLHSGELPVVSIQDTEELPLGENLTDDIFAIMNSEGIQSADDITNVADWKNIIQDIGNMQDINFPSTDTVQSQDLYPTVDSSLAGYTISDTDLSNLHFATTSSPLLPTVIDSSLLNAQALKPVPTTPSTKGSSRKSSKTKSNLREYDPNKHCGVVTAENPKPCTRSLTCKAHALSLRRTVDGRAKPFDTLLAEHRAARDAAHHAAALPAPPPAPAPPAELLNGLAAEQHVHDIYASLLSAEEPALPAASSLGAPAGAAPPAPPDAPPPLPGDVCWYAASPRPLALCTFNAAHAGGAVTLGKRFATVRGSIKAALSRSSKGAYAGAGALPRPAGARPGKPELRRLVLACGRSALGELLEPRPLNGHVRKARALKGRALELGFALDPLLADEKC